MYLTNCHVNSTIFVNYCKKCFCCCLLFLNKINNQTLTSLFSHYHRFICFICSVLSSSFADSSASHVYLRHCPFGNKQWTTVRKSERLFQMFFFFFKEEMYPTKTWVVLDWPAGIVQVDKLEAQECEPGIHK